MGPSKVIYWSPLAIFELKYFLSNEIPFNELAVKSVSSIAQQSHKEHNFQKLQTHRINSSDFFPN